MYSLVLPLLSLFLPIAAMAASQSEIDALALKIEKPLKAARYMEGNCAPVTIAGWENHATLRCSYNVRDKKQGTNKPGLVLMLNPSATLLSAWIINACQSIQPAANPAKCAKRLSDRVISQSGGQFPIAGIVYEDLIPKDGIYESYGFASGITTVLNGVKHRNTTALGAEELEFSLTAAPIKTASDSAFARIVGVTRSEYKKSNPSVDVTGLNWLKVVAEEYKKAMKGERNALLEAWLAANDS
jgi:hypothetical protein